MRLVVRWGSSPAGRPAGARTAASAAPAVVALTMVAALSLAACGSDRGNGPAAGDGKAPAVGENHAPHDGFSVPPPAPLRDGEYFKTLTLPAAYTPQAPNGGTDEYRCFVLDTDLVGPAFLTGTQFLPQNPAIVHHAILFQVAPEHAERVRQHDRDTPGQGWPCFGGAGLDGGAGSVDDAAWIGSWAPGTTEMLLAANLGYPMQASGLLVIQIHYNLLATDGRPGSDQSSIRLRLNDRTEGMTPLSTGLLFAPVELPCAPTESGPLCDRAAAVADVTKRFGAAAGAMVDRLQRFCNRGRAPAADDTQHCDHTVTAPATIHALGAHMHLLGRSLTVELNPGRPDARTLLDVPNYDFDDQALRPLPEPVRVRPGDTLRITCTHDATLRQRLPQLADTPPRYVVWGDGTADEMCLGVMVQSAGG